MKKILLLFLLTLWMPITILAQNGLESATKKINSLKKNKVDTIVSCYRYSSGIQTMPSKKGEDCFLTASQIIFWTKDGEYFKQYFDNCNNYKEKKIDSTIFIKFARDSVKVLQEAEIKAVNCVFTDMSGNKNYKKLPPPRNSKFTEFTFHLDGLTIFKKIDHYNMITESCDSEYLNDNYEANQASILKLLFDEATDQMRDK